MPRLITDEAALAALEAEYNRRKAWQTGGLQLAWIEKALHDAKTAAILGYPTQDLLVLAQYLHSKDITPDELHDIACNLHAAFEFVNRLLSKEQQEAVNKALSHWKLPAPEDN